VIKFFLGLGKSNTFLHTRVHDALSIINFISATNDNDHLASQKRHREKDKKVDLKDS